MIVEYGTWSLFLERLWLPYKIREMVGRLYVTWFWDECMSDVEKTSMN